MSPIQPGAHLLEVLLTGGVTMLAVTFFKDRDGRRHFVQTIQVIKGSLQIGWCAKIPKIPSGWGEKMDQAWCETFECVSVSPQWTRLLARAQESRDIKVLSGLYPALAGDELVHSSLNTIFQFATPWLGVTFGILWVRMKTGYTWWKVSGSAPHQEFWNPELQSSAQTTWSLPKEC